MVYVRQNDCKTLGDGTGSSRTYVSESLEKVSTIER